MRGKNLILLVAVTFFGFQFINPNVILAGQGTDVSRVVQNDVTPIPDPPDQPDDSDDEEVAPEIDPEEDQDLVPEEDSDDFLPIE